jgi:hypothetical protein
MIVQLNFLKSVAKDLSGAIIKCEITANGETIVSETKLNVEMKSKLFLKKLEDLEVPVGSTVILECEIDVEGEPIQWMFQGKQVEKDDRHIIEIEGNKHLLTINAIEENEMGYYGAQIRDEQTTAELTLALEPSITLESDNMFDSAGTDLNIPVSVRSNPKAEITWYKLDQEGGINVVNVGNFTEQVSEDDQYLTTFTFTMESLNKLEQSGNYLIDAKNKYENAGVEFTLSIQDKPSAFSYLFLASIK